MSDQEELTKLDILLRRKQAFWETPRNLAIIVGVVAALFGALTGITGYQIGHRAPPPVVIEFRQPLAVKVLP